MKILICTSEYPPTVGGFANVAYNIKKQLEKKGHKVDVFKPKTPIKNGMDTLMFWKNAYYYMWGRSEKYDVFWCQNPLFTQIDYSDLFLQKVICTTHTTYNGRWEHMWFNNPFKALYYKWMNLQERTAFLEMRALTFTTTTKKTQKELEKLGVKCSAVIPNGVDTNEFKPKGKKKKHKFCVVSRLAPWKNVGEVVDMFNEKVWKDLEVVIAGDGPEFKKLKKKANSHIKMLGNISKAKVIKLYQESTYFVSASKYEGMPLTLLEAMACGCRPTVSMIPGHKELTDHFVKECGVKATDKQIASFIKKNYDWSKIVDRYIEVFK